MTPHVLHIIHRLTRGGAGRALTTLATASAATGEYAHRALSYLPADGGLVKQLQGLGVAVVDAPDRDTLWRAISHADIVHVHFWNTPELYRLLRSDWPACRVVLCPHIGGLYAPQVITRALVDYADLVMTVSPFAYALPVFQSLAAEQAAKVHMILATADLSRVQAVKPRSHEFFNIGYIGTLNPIKIHPDFINLCAQIDLPTARFVLCGSATDYQRLARQAERVGLSQRFDYRGYVEDLTPVLAELDVFGYPLCEDNYSAADLILQEIMAAGIPPVLFPYGGTASLVQHNHTGLIVHTAQEYATAIHYLYHHPDERRRLGEAAAAYAATHFEPAQAIQKLHPLYEHLLGQPKQPRRLADAPTDASGADAFVASLGEAAPQFEVSLRSHDLSAILEAEQTIVKSSPVLCGDANGGIFHYRNAYPQDCHLRLWAGLALLGQGQHVRALAEFQAAHTLGLAHWRLFWYIAQVGAGLKARQVVVPALQRVIQAAPEFAPAHAMRRAWLID